MFETIVALATPPMKSALAIVRLSGDDCFDVVSKIFSKNIRDITKRTALVGQIKYNETLIDDVVVNVYKGPKSFTGEDSVEIICHGSLLIANEIIQACLASGARLATNGEYSSRAFMHNKIDLVQAEAINDVINATSKESKNISLMSLSGETSSLIYPIKKRIADILSLIEVNIDFPEYEDIEVANKEMVVSVADEIHQMISKLINDGEKAIIIKEGIKTAIVGKPNVGKSSLLNALLGEEKAIVTEIAGTTRDVVEGDVNVGGIILHLLDTAGIHEANDIVENIGINKAKSSLDEAELVIAVLDASSKLSKEDEEILKLTENKRRIVVYNKSDLLVEKIDGNIYISAKENNLDELIKQLRLLIGIEESAFKNPALNNTRQIGLLKKADNALKKAKEDALNNLSVDLLSVSLMEAYKAVLEILGEENQADFAKEIFSRFCVGK
ncbi:MAG: tRNA uridine-5-carboxymethylaminomethyl(34) synthesis GTPase MnmE [Bacilli bacterium]|nr:tRNA uridine-5-carboxymethylaminomethyl(34) synthesis GTPase MnmE [Bacilli bacterium]